MADSDFDMLSHFGALDELIQLIYQGSNKFVLLSAVSSVHWTLHLGLTNSGRWWSGYWSEKDIFKFLGTSNASTKLVEAFADRLADNIVKGELFIGNWSAEENDEIILTLNPSAKSPAHIPLSEMDAPSAAVYTCKMFSDIASHAQKSQKCRLYPSAPELVPRESRLYPPAASSATSPSGPRSVQAASCSTHSNTRPPVASVKDTAGSSKGKQVASRVVHEPTVAERTSEKIKELEAELARAQREVKEVKRKATNMDENGQENLLASRAKNVAPAVKPVKGASLANPNKKARRYQAIEFDD